MCMLIQLKQRLRFLLSCIGSMSFSTAMHQRDLGLALPKTCPALARSCRVLPFQLIWPGFQPQESSWEFAGSLRQVHWGTQACCHSRGIFTATGRVIPDLRSALLPTPLGIPLTSALCTAALWVRGEPIWLRNNPFAVFRSVHCKTYYTGAEARKTNHQVWRTESSDLHLSD